MPREGCQRIVCPVQLSGLNMEEGRLLKQTENKWRGIPHSRPGTIGRKKETGLGPQESSVPKRRGRANQLYIEDINGSIPQILTSLPCPTGFASKGTQSFPQ